jgi:hypothetical protein
VVESRRRPPRRGQSDGFVFFCVFYFYFYVFDVYVYILSIWDFETAGSEGSDLIVCNFTWLVPSFLTLGWTLITVVVA